MPKLWKKCSTNAQRRWNHSSIPSKRNFAEQQVDYRDTWTRKKVSLVKISVHHKGTQWFRFVVPSYNMFQDKFKFSWEIMVIFIIIWVDGVGVELFSELVSEKNVKITEPEANQLMTALERALLKSSVRNSKTYMF